MLDSSLILDLYRLHGAVLFRGFGTKLDEFRTFAEQFCSSSVFNESPDRKLLDGRGNIQSVNGGEDAFPLHPELSREPWKPDVAFFFCITPPREQGQTTVCDGVALVAALPAEVREGLANRRLVYRQPASLDHLEYWLGTSSPSDAQLNAPPGGCPYAYVREGRQVWRSFSRPALHRPMFGGEPAFGNFLLFARYYLGRRGFPALDDGSAVPDAWLDAIRDAGERLSVPVGWQAGDVLMLDNTRFMHGRTAIVDPGDRLIATYFGYLDAATPDAEEPVDAIWRRTTFVPPAQGRASGMEGKT